MLMMLDKSDDIESGVDDVNYDVHVQRSNEN